MATPSRVAINLRSGREALASVGAATLQDEPAALRRHARTEPVAALAAQVARLVRALHSWPLFGMDVAVSLKTASKGTAAMTLSVKDPPAAAVFRSETWSPYR